MESYKSAEIEVIRFQVNDIITTSCPGGYEEEGGD